MVPRHGFTCHALPSSQAYRCDVLPSPMSGGKHALVLALLESWRRGAVLHGSEQWRTFYEHEVLDAQLKSFTSYDQVGASFG